MGRRCVHQKVKHKPTPHLILHSRTGKKTIRKVSHYAEFTSKDVLCPVCNIMSEIRKEPTRCNMHITGDYA